MMHAVGAMFEDNNKKYFLHNTGTSTRTSRGTYVLVQ